MRKKLLAPATCTVFHKYAPQGEFTSGNLEEVTEETP